MKEERKAPVHIRSLKALSVGLLQRNTENTPGRSYKKLYKYLYVFSFMFFQKLFIQITLLFFRVLLRLTAHVFSFFRDAHMRVRIFPQDTGRQCRVPQGTQRKILLFR